MGMGIPVVHPKRIQHLSRYFGVLAILCFVGYGWTPYSYYFLAALGPSFFIAHWLRLHGGLIVQFIPDNSFSNNFFLLFPVTFIYFGLVGFLIKNILNERGRMRTIVLILFLGFLVYLHHAAFKELSLYWEGSAGLSDRGAARNFTFGN